MSDPAQAYRLLRRLLDGLLVVLIAVVLFGVFLRTAVPLSGRQTLIVGGPSMEPAIPLGAAVVIGRVEPDRLALGDVVTFKPGVTETFVTHRIITLVERPDGLWIRTKGDNNDQPDPALVPATAVVGRLQASIPLAGFLVALLSVAPGILFVLCVAGTLLVSIWLLESLELDRLALDRRRLQVLAVPGRLVDPQPPVGGPQPR